MMKSGDISKASFNANMKPIQEGAVKRKSRKTIMIRIPHMVIFMLTLGSQGTWSLEVVSKRMTGALEAQLDVVMITTDSDHH